MNFYDNNVLMNQYNNSSCDNEYIVWIDVEASGTNPEIHNLLEIASVITDMSGQQIGQSYTSLVNVKNLSQVISLSDINVQKMHDKSGLWSDLWNKESYSLQHIEKDLITWLINTVGSDSIIYFGGNSITLDRNFVNFNFPDFYKMISYRSVDVTSISLTVQSNSTIDGFRKGKNHRALDDAYNSIEEYKYYVRNLKNFIND